MRFCFRRSQKSRRSAFVHHKACRGILVIDSEATRDADHGRTLKGVTMSDYLERYEDHNRRQIESKDKQLLKRLTPNTLFCSSCFKPLLIDDFERELISPYVALLEYVSALTFVLIPIAWLLLI